MNYTKTQGGARLLRSTILQPLCDKVTIETRYGAIEELLANENLYFQISGFLNDFLDLF